MLDCYLFSKQEPSIWEEIRSARPNVSDEFWQTKLTGKDAEYKQLEMKTLSLSSFGEWALQQKSKLQLYSYSLPVDTLNKHRYSTTTTDSWIHSLKFHNRQRLTDEVIGSDEEAADEEEGRRRPIVKLEERWVNVCLRSPVAGLRSLSKGSWKAKKR